MIPQTADDPQIGPQMIPDGKWSRKSEGMEFVPRSRFPFLA